MPRAYGELFGAALLGFAVMAFLKNGVVPIALGRGGPRFYISCSTQPRLYWLVILASAIIAIYCAVAGLRDFFGADGMRLWT